MQFLVTLVAVGAFGLGLLAGRDLKAVTTARAIRAQLDLKVESAAESICDRVKIELRSAKFRS